MSETTNVLIHKCLKIEDKECFAIFRKTSSKYKDKNLWNPLIGVPLLFTVYCYSRKVISHLKSYNESL